MGMFETPLPDFLVLLLAAVVIVTAFRFLRLSPVLGYLAAGAVIGPTGFHLVRNADTVHDIGEFGIVFLMFMIGLELSWDRLKAMRSQVLLLGTWQLVFTAAAFTYGAHALGVGYPACFIIGAGLAMSSTAVVMQVLESRSELSSQSGRLALAVLILQDMAVLPLLVLLPILASKGGSLMDQLESAGLRAYLALMCIAIVGRLIVRPLFRVIARLNSNELFVATTLLVLLGMSWAAELGGLSSALGAFIAGLLVAETEFQHQIEADVKPFKSLLMGLFFMTVGMKIDLAFLRSHVLDMLFWTLGIISIKAVILFVLLRLRAFGQVSSIRVALLMAQGGEFSFILFSLAAQLGLLPEEMSESLLVAVTVTMAVTPLLDSLGAWLERRARHRVRMHPERMRVATSDLNQHVIVVGYSSMGQSIADFLTHEKIPFVVLDTDPAAVALGQAKHAPVFFGDATRGEVLTSIGVARASAFIITINDADTAKLMLMGLRIGYPLLPVLLRTSDFNHERVLLELGAAVAVPELQVASMRLIAGLLEQLKYPEEEIRRAMRDMRG